MNQTSTGEAVLFWLLAPVAVAAALGMIGVRKAVHSALMLAVVMICLAVFFGAQQAPFLAVVQVVVYTGAVMMLFLFVLMLIGVDSADSLVETIRGQRIAAVLAGAGFGILVLAGIGNGVFGDFNGLTQANAGGNVQGVGELIFTRYILAFEVTSALLITAALGAMVLAHREQTGRKHTQRERSMERFRSGSYRTPLPAPGVYARHNAVDTPGLLPDGTPAELSVSPILRARGDVRGVEAARRGGDPTPPTEDEAAATEGSQLGKGATP